VIFAVADPNSVLTWLPVIGGVGGLLLLWSALRTARRRRLVDSLPTCKTTGVFIGLVEVKGTAEARNPIMSRFAAVPCVHFGWQIEEKWSRVVTETTTDSKGNTQTTIRNESGWTTVAKGTEQIAFYLKDDCGFLLIRPDRAELECETVFDTTCNRSHPLYFGKGPAESIADSDHERRFSEVAIKLHAPIYVLGQAREREDVVAAEIAHDKNAPLFLISTRSEKQISGGYTTGFWVRLLFGLAACSAGCGFGLTARWPNAGQQWIPFALGAAAYALAAAMAWIWAVFNGLIDLRNRVASAWSQVDVQLKRRFDLIPRLEGVVKGLTAHERTVQENIAALRTQREATAPGEAGPDFQALGGQVVALVERYPELKTDTSFLKLQQELAATEQRIALARGYYNEIATHYNTKLEVVPERFVAGLGRLQPRPLFAAGDFERAAVRIEG
jgi:hypothetical protein